MFSKLSLAALVASQANALITKGSTTYVAATHADYVCARCVAEDYRYCTTDTTYSNIASLMSSTGACVAKDGTCANNAIQITNSVELAIAACPTDNTICGSTVWTDFTAADDAAVTVTPAGALTQYSSCNIGFHTACGAPMEKKNVATAFEGNMAIFHYTGDSRTTLADDSASTSTKFPAIASTVYDLDTNCASAGQCSAMDSMGNQMVFKLDSSTIYQADDIIMAYMAYSESKATYYKSFFDEYKLYAMSESYTFFDYILSIMTFGLAKPTSDPIDTSYPGAYAGKVWSALTTLGGWGDLSVQTFTLDSSFYYEFGTYGKVQSIPTTVTSNAVDTNTASCVDRYALVQIYASTAGTAANAALVGQPMALSTENGDFTAPTTMTELEGASILKAGVAVAAAVAALW